VALSPGTRLGPYEIVAPLGAGGMGEVYRARDTRLDRAVAVKILPEEMAKNERLRARFEREAKTISSLNHPNICTLFDVGEGYLVMELLEGESLAERIARNGALPLVEVLRYGAQIADALDRAHRAGIVHRDLKPGNVMITKGGAKLLDFGLAKSGVFDAPLDAATQQKPLTEEGAIVGTFQYMAPEQIEGQEVDYRADIWALGCLLYEMATGRAPFVAGSRASLIGTILRDDPPPLSSLQPMLPRTLDHIIRTCLAKDPDARWQSARDIERELQFVSEVRESEVVPASRRPTTRRAFIGAVGVFVIAVAAAFAVGRLWRSGPPANAVPVVVLMDSTHPLRIYDPVTRANGGTNADDLTDLLHDLPVVLAKENTTWTWHREDEVLRQRPDLVVAHRSCFYVPSGSTDENFEKEFYARASDKFETLMAYIALGNPRTKFIVYSRGSWKTDQERDAWVKAVENRFPLLNGRIVAYKVPLARATFRNAQTGAEMRAMVMAALGIKR
jgi:serine/threonine protein kinase